MEDILDHGMEIKKIQGETQEEKEISHLVIITTKQFTMNSITKLSNHSLRGLEGMEDILDHGMENKKIRDQTWKTYSTMEWRTKRFETKQW